MTPPSKARRIWRDRSLRLRHKIKCKIRNFFAQMPAILLLKRLDITQSIKVEALRKKHPAQPQCQVLALEVAAQPSDFLPYREAAENIPRCEIGLLRFEMPDACNNTLASSSTTRSVERIASRLFRFSKC